MIDFGADAMASYICVQENAKSSAVEFCGMVLSSPFGVKTKISEANKFNLIVSRKSMASGCGSSSISLMVRSHFSIHLHLRCLLLLYISSGRQILVRLHRSSVRYVSGPRSVSVVSHQGDMQCLVSIGFRVAHPVAQAVGVGFIDFRD